MGLSEPMFRLSGARLGYVAKCVYIYSSIYIIWMR